MFWSTIQTTPAKKPVRLALKSDGVRIGFDALVSRIPEARNGFWYYVQLGLYTGFLQTIQAGNPLHKQWKIYYGRRIFRCTDGSQFSVDYALPTPNSDDWARDVNYAPIKNLPRYPIRTRYLMPEEVSRLDNPDETRPLLILIHGLTGGSHESYLRSVVAEIEEKAPHFECCVITSRGCNRTKISTPTLFNGAWTIDLQRLVNHVREHQPQRPVYACGFSLGASILANYLGQQGDKSGIVAACVVSNPWDLNLASWSMNYSFISKYLCDRTMTQNLLRVLKNNFNELNTSELFMKLWEASDGGKNIKTLSDFDDGFTAPMFGFDSARDYYRTGSSVNRLHSIRTPLLVIAAKDDPVVCDNVVPYEEGPLNPYIHIVTASRGGHLGFFGARGRRWSSDVVSSFFKMFDAEVDCTQRVDAELPHKHRIWHHDRFMCDEKATLIN